LTSMPDALAEKSKRSLTHAGRKQDRTDEWRFVIDLKAHSWIDGSDEQSNAVKKTVVFYAQSQVGVPAQHGGCARSSSSVVWSPRPLRWRDNTAVSCLVRGALRRRRTWTSGCACSTMPSRRTCASGRRSTRGRRSRRCSSRRSSTPAEVRFVVLAHDACCGDHDAMARR
jgi:hypothetical protein